MEIIDNTRKKIKFADIDVGTVFMGIGSDIKDKIFMKIEAEENSIYDIMNAICFNDNYIHHFSEHEVVMPVTASLTIS